MFDYNFRSFGISELTRFEIHDSTEDLEIIRKQFGIDLLFLYTCKDSVLLLRPDLCLIIVLVNFMNWGGGHGVFLISYGFMCLLRGVSALSLALFLVCVVVSVLFIIMIISLGEERAGFLRICLLIVCWMFFFFLHFVDPLGVMGWLQLVIVALP